MRRMDRRTFLALGAAGLAWACTRSSDDAADPGDEALSLIPTGQQGLAQGDTRNGFGLLRGLKPYAPREVEARLVPPSGEPFRIEVDRQKVERGLGGDDHEHAEVEDIYVFRHDLEVGIWTIQVIADGDPAEGAFQVVDKVPSPTVGQGALPTQSPTTSDPRGVDPICTRDPVCSMHELTIAEALNADKPLVIAFATPQFCTSRFCGPVVDLVEEQKERVGAEANFIHVEVWKDTKSVGQRGGEAPAFAEWKFDTEPWIYFIGADGVVKDRWIGAAGGDELRRAVDGLLA